MYKRKQWRGLTHRGTAAAAADPRPRSSARRGVRWTWGERRPPAASRALPGYQCPLYGAAGPRPGWAAHPGLCWIPGWRQCCGRGPLQRCPHLSPSRGSCWVTSSCRPPCSWYPVTNASERPGTGFTGEGKKERISRRSPGRLSVLSSPI